MAQSKGFFGRRKGSTKSLTFSVLDGKQITKDRVYDVKNPRTDLAIADRIYQCLVAELLGRNQQEADIAEPYLFQNVVTLRH